MKYLTKIPDNLRIYKKMYQLIYKLHATIRNVL